MEQVARPSLQELRDAAHRAQPALSFLLCEAGDGIEDAP